MPYVVQAFQLGAHHKENCDPNIPYLSSDDLLHKVLDGAHQLKWATSFLEKNGQQMREKARQHPNEWIVKRDTAHPPRELCYKAVKGKFSFLLPIGSLGEGSSRKVNKVLFVPHQGKTAIFAETCAKTDMDFQKMQREAKLFSNLYNPLQAECVYYNTPEGRLLRMHAPCFKQSLEKYYESRGFSPALAPKIIGKLASDFAKLHKAGICHADIKLANVCLDEELNPFVIDLADSQEIGSSSSFIGDDEYCAPEILSEEVDTPEQHISEKRDVWALGVVALKMINRDLDNKLQLAISRRFLPRGRERLLETIGLTRDALEKIEPIGPAISSMLHPDPEERPSARKIAGILADL